MNPMHDTPRRPSITLLATTLLAAGFIPGARPVQGDIVTAFYSSSSSYGYEINHMPDLDQRREAANGGFGLPGNGSMYCVPTSTMNMIMYAANHGFPSVSPGTGLWQLQSNYNPAGLALLNLGNNFMGTSPTDGTNGSQWLNGTKAWLNPTPYFTVTQYTVNGFYSPRTHTMTQTAVSGALVSFAYGRYDITGSVNGRPLISRSGGHVVTLSKTNSGFGLNKIWVRDPADDPDKNSDPANYKTYQSPFGNRMLNAEDHNFAYGAGSGEWRTMTALNYDSGSDKVALIDQYTAIAPKSGYSFTTGIGGIFKLKFFHPFKFLGSGLASSSEVDLDGISNVNDAIIHPDLFWYVVLTEDPTGGLPKLGMAHDALEPVRDAPAADVKRMVFGRNRRLYLLGDTRLYCLNVDEPGWPEEAAVDLPAVCEALTYDDATDEVVVLSVGEMSILTYPSTLPAGVGPMVHSIPGTVPMAGQAAIACSPQEPGSYWFLSDGSDSLYRLTPSALARGVNIEEVSMAGIVRPTCVSFDDMGHMFVDTNDQVKELMRDAASGEWSEVNADEAMFSGFAVGPMFRVTRSRTNFMDTEHSGPAWRNLDPDTEPLESGAFEMDCLSDSNGDRVVDVVDLLKLLAEWGACEPCLTDTDGNRTIDVLDLLSLLGDWGACQ